MSGRLVTAVINFFADDSVTSGTENGSGFVDAIPIFDGALTTGEGGALGPIPEPSTALLVAIGLVGVVGP